jgi:hypothetical protein
MVLMFQICILVSQDQRAAPLPAPSTSEFHSNGKQLDLPKFEMQLLNWKDALTGEGSLSMRLLTSQLHSVHSDRAA